MIKIKLLFILITFAFMLYSCKYDNIENLYPATGDCDTTNISYANDVWPIIGSNCTSCHSGNAPSGNVNLENHEQIKAAGINGSLLGVIKHENGWSPMPKGTSKLPDCDILKIETWGNNGYPDN